MAKNGGGALHRWIKEDGPKDDIVKDTGMSIDDTMEGKRKTWAELWKEKGMSENPQEEENYENELNEIEEEIQEQTRTWGNSMEPFDVDLLDQAIKIRKENTGKCVGQICLERLL